MFSTHSLLVSWQQIVSRLSVILIRSLVAILYYDYALTFSREVEHFWPNPYYRTVRTGWVSFVFLLNRYFAILGHIPIVIGLIPSKSCEVGYRFFSPYCPLLFDAP